MTAGFFLLILLLLLTIAVTAALWSRRQATEGIAARRGGQGLPVCGGCGYAVRGVSTLTCPECGADLREVGILPPGYRGSSRASLLVLWSLAMLILSAILIPMITSLAAPVRVSVGNSIHLELKSALGLRFDAALNSHGIRWFAPWSGPQTGSVTLDEATLEVIGVAGNTPPVAIRYRQGAWEMETDPKRGFVPLAVTTLGPWLTAQAHMDATEADELAQATINQVRGIHHNYHLTRMTSSNGAHSMSSSGTTTRNLSTSPHAYLKITRQSSKSQQAAPGFALGITTVAIGVWAFGVRRIVRGDSTTRREAV